MRIIFTTNIFIFSFLLVTLNHSFTAKIDNDKYKNHDMDYSHEESLRFFKDYNLSTDIAVYKDFNQYYFRNYSEFSKSSTIYRMGDIKILPKKEDAKIGQIRANTSVGKDLTLDEYLEKSTAEGFIVIHRGKIVYEKYPKMNDYEHHVLKSVTKQFVGLLIAMAQNEQLIDYNKSITDYIPELKGSGWDMVKVRHALNMNSGMGTEHYITEADKKIFFSWTTPMLGRNNKHPNIIDAMKNLKPVAKPGGEREYFSPNTIVLTMILEKVYNKSFNTLMTEKIWSKIGAEHDANIGIIEDLKIGGGVGLMSSTLRDLARYGLLYTPSYKIINNNKIISDKNIKDIQSTDNKAPLSENLKNRVGYITHDKQTIKGSHSAYQWDIVLSDGSFIKGGINGQGLFISPNDDFVIAHFMYGGNYFKTDENIEIFDMQIAKYLKSLK